MGEHETVLARTYRPWSWTATEVCCKGCKVMEDDDEQLTYIEGTIAARGT